MGTVEPPWPVKSSAHTGPGQAASDGGTATGDASPSPCRCSSGRPVPDRRQCSASEILLCRSITVDTLTTTPSRGPTQELEHQVGDQPGLLDVHEVPDAIQRLEASAGWEE